MPFKLVPPRKGRSKNYRLRGTECGVCLDESTGTHRRAAAEAYLRRRRAEVEGGLSGGSPQSTFAAAVVDYVAACPQGEVARVNRALEHFGTTPLSDIDDNAVAAYAKIAYPPGPVERRDKLNATINREIVSPVAAVCHAGGLERRFKRYKEPRGRVRNDPVEAVAAFLEALPERTARVYRKLKREDPPRYPRALALFTFCCNPRRGDAFELDWPNMNLAAATAHFPKTKNGLPRTVHLPPVVLAAIASIPHRDGKVFGYRSRYTINKDWALALEKVLPDYPVLKGLSPHGGRHDFANWAREGGADVKKLMDMGGWEDPRSVLRYQHVPTKEIRDALDASPLNRVESVESGQEPKKDAM